MSQSNHSDDEVNGNVSILKCPPPLSWSAIVGLKNNELVSFLKEYSLPYSERSKLQMLQMLYFRTRHCDDKKKDLICKLQKNEIKDVDFVIFNYHKLYNVQFDTSGKKSENLRLICGSCYMTFEGFIHLYNSNKYVVFNPLISNGCKWSSKQMHIGNANCINFQLYQYPMQQLTEKDFESSDDIIQLVIVDKQEKTIWKKRNMDIEGPNSLLSASKQKKLNLSFDCINNDNNHDHNSGNEQIDNPLDQLLLNDNNETLVKDLDADNDTFFNGIDLNDLAKNNQNLTLNEFVKTNLIILDDHQLIINKLFSCIDSKNDDETIYVDDQMVSWFDLADNNIEHDTFPNMIVSDFNQACMYLSGKNKQKNLIRQYYHKLQRA
ncbi:hypothetical protein RFI_33892, partial [Reticulomyxa filosa]